MVTLDILIMEEKFQPLIMLISLRLAVDLSDMDFIVLKKIPSIFQFINHFYHERMLYSVILLQYLLTII